MTNMKLNTINIKGKEYVMVNERIKAFRKLYKDYSLESEVLKLDEKECIIKAVIRDTAGRILATGLSKEVYDEKSMINKSAYVENCETSAWGRALGNLGIGIDNSIASADEMVVKVKFTMDDFKKIIENATTTTILDNLYFVWRTQYKPDSIEYKTLFEMSEKQKKNIGEESI